MKHTMLALALIVLLSSAAPASRGNIDDGDVAGPNATSSLSSGAQGNTVSNPGNLNTDFNGIQLNNGVMLYLAALLY